MGSNKPRIVVYTAIFGGKDDLQEPTKGFEGVDFICFSDSLFSSQTWKIKNVPQKFTDPVRSARYYKVLPHLLFPDYDISIWVDGNMKVLKTPRDLVQKFINGSKIAIYNHSHLKRRKFSFFWIKDPDARNCIYDEGETIISRAQKGRYQDDPDLVRKQMEKYKQEKYPAHYGLVSSMVVIREHNNREVIHFMEGWWKEIEEGSRRDQLSFNYIGWKTKIPFIYLPGNSRCNKYFRRVPHKIGKSYKPDL